MAYYTKKQAAEMITSAINSNYAVSVHILRSYLQEHLPEASDLSDFDVLELNDDVSDHFQVTDEVRHKVDRELGHILNVY